LGDCCAGVSVRGLQFAAVHEYEYAGLRGYDRGGDQCGELHLQHGAADGDQLRCCDAGLATAFFIPEHSQSNPALMIDGLHKALVSLGVLTILSTTVFGSLKSGDGRAVSQQKAIHPAG